MGVLSMLLDGPPTALRPGLTPLASSAIRNWVTTTYGVYLLRVGKTRWCDKSLGSEESANRFLDLFPGAKFICLYRNCLDLIDSAIEACPFGLRGYGMDAYAAAHPGNSVAAVADYWVSHTRGISEFERAHPDVCLRLRYEDLASDPEAQADRIFAFLGERPVPGISESCLPNGRDPFGPSDHKIWSTSAITPDSVGRGSRIPAGLIAPPVQALINDLLDRLGYAPVGGEEHVRAVPHDQDDGSTMAGGSSGVETGSAAALDELDELLASRLSERAARVGDDDEAAAAAPPLLITATAPADDGGMARARWWRVDPATALLTRGGSQAPDNWPDQWTATGEASTWRSVLTGDMNIGTAIRQGHIRYSGTPSDRANTARPLRADTHAGTLTRLFAPPVARQHTTP
jgi:hypothetical protein